MGKVKFDSHERRDVDPDYFDLIVQSLSILSSIVQLGASWLAIREQPQQSQRQNEIPNLNIEEPLRQVERNFEDVFFNLKRALRVLETAYNQSTGLAVQDQEPRFGSAMVRLSQSEMQSIMPLLSNLSTASTMLRSNVLAIENNLNFHKPRGEENINFDLSAFNDDLNGILFGSKTIGEAVEKLSKVEFRADEFLRSVKVSLRGN